MNVGSAGYFAGVLGFSVCLSLSLLVVQVNDPPKAKTAHTNSSSRFRNVFARMGRVCGLSEFQHPHARPRGQGGLVLGARQQSVGAGEREHVRRPFPQ